MADPGPLDRGRRRIPTDLAWLVCCLLGGIAVGALWRVLIGVLVDQADPERAVAVDGVLGVLCLLAGVLVGIGLMVTAPLLHWSRFLLVLTGSAAGAAVAWGTGLVLGVRQLGAIGAPFLWPVGMSATAFLVMLTGGLRKSTAPGDRSQPAAGQPEQVVGAQFDVQAAPARADQDGAVLGGARVDHGGQRLPLAERADPADDVTG
jgi:hypothetical protein